MEKINVAELLKDCPQGMELDCTIFDTKVIYKGIIEIIHDYPIVVQTEHGFEFKLTQYGQIYNFVGAECVIFPKGKTTWEGFIPPCKFKDGDVISDSLGTCIFKGEGVVQGTVDYYCGVHSDYFIVKQKPDEHYGNIVDYRLATEEEKAKLFQAIKDNGYEWNSDTKTLNELKIKKGKWYVCIKDLLDNYANKAFWKGDIYHSPENGKLMPGNSNIPYEVLLGNEYFREWTISDAKDGDVLYSDVNDNGDDDDCYKYVFILKEINGDMVIAHCFINVDRFIPTETYLVENIYPIRLATEEEEARLFQAIKDYGYKWNPKTKTLEMLIEPKFKVGDIIRLKDDDEKPFYKIINIKNDCYITDQGELSFRYEYLWELVPNKFDINTLKPYESRVLVRDSNKEKWKPNFWGFYDIDSAMNYPYECCGISYAQCIPYEGNEHLFGTNNDCDEYYKTWE